MLPSHTPSPQPLCIVTVAVVLVLEDSLGSDSGQTFQLCDGLKADLSEYSPVGALVLEPQLCVRCSQPKRSGPFPSLNLSDV